MGHSDASSFHCMQDCSTLQMHGKTSRVHPTYEIQQFKWYQLSDAHAGPNPTQSCHVMLCPSKFRRPVTYRALRRTRAPQTVARPWCSVLPVTHRAIPQSCRVLPQTLPSSALSTTVWNVLDLTGERSAHTAVRCFEKDDFISSPFLLWNVLTFPLHLCKTSVYKRY
jgi:hypothetical protein